MWVGYLHVVWITCAYWRRYNMALEYM